MFRLRFIGFIFWLIEAKIEAVLPKNENKDSLDE
jgi:hypothetical protein